MLYSEDNTEGSSLSAPCAAQKRLQSPVTELDALVLLLVSIVALPLFMLKHKKGHAEEQI